MRKIFVTGIGTDVGKTVVSAMVVEALKADYWKPVQTGAYYTTDGSKIEKYISNGESKVHPEAYNLKQYMSPHAAAEAEGIEIDIEKITLPEVQNKTLIIEGAGGLMVPLNHKHMMVDLIQKFEAEVIVVIQNYLGSINHSLLTLEALKNRNIKVLGIVFNGAPHQLSHEIILEYSKVPLLGKIVKENEINKEVVLRCSEQFRNI